LADPVIIVDYDPRWVDTFSMLRDEIAESFGDLPITIEHVGSTSVRGAAAKPIIDIDLVVGSPEAVPKAIELLGQSGYRHLGDLGIKGREAFESPARLPAHHLYVVVVGSPEYTRHLRFRDFMRSHPQEVKRYSELKKSLAKKFRDDREAYTEAKTEFIEEILRRAASSERT
jgi:GrpB-like predicted nucleotidyltransferase (UPF0157 family)